MKKILLILFALVSLIGYSQRSGSVVYLEADTIKGADTVYIYFPSEDGDFKSLYSLSLEIYFEEIGGTSDGTVYWQACNDSNWYSLNTVEGVFLFAPNDTVTIGDGVVAASLIYGNAFNKIRAMCVGTAGDTTLLRPNYVRK